jgi:hypothetical protein
MTRSSSQELGIDFLVYFMQYIDVANLSEIQRRFYDQLLTELAHVRSLSEEESLLRSAVEQHRRVQAELGLRKRRANQLAALIGPDKLKKQKGIDPVFLKQVRESMTRVALWAGIGLILEQKAEVRIAELHRLLQRVGFTVSRQAVESAIDYHKETFQTRATEKREKFVSLR